MLPQTCEPNIIPLHVAGSIHSFLTQLNLDITKLVKIGNLLCYIEILLYWYSTFYAVTGKSFFHGRGRKIFRVVGKLEESYLNVERKFILLNLWVDDEKDKVSCRVDDIFTSAVRNIASHTFASTQHPQMIVSPAVGRHYHEKRWQQGANALSASRFNTSLKLDIMQPPVLNAWEESARYHAILACPLLADVTDYF